MEAVVFKGPLHVAVETRPIPTLQESTDAIVRVRYTAVCGSELHVYRGHQPSTSDFIMGHEFTGEVVETGEAVTKIKVGDRVVSPFTTSCGECFYCERGFSSRCEKSQLFGSAGLDGAQAEYCRIPLADTTLVKAPPSVHEEKLILMADIFPTGYFAAFNAFHGLDTRVMKESIVVLIGCGPVGICALINALEYKPKIILAVDSVQPRLDLANNLGAEAWNYQLHLEEMKRRVHELSDGRGADIVIESVGHSDALDLGFDLLRPWGNISSIGVHNGSIPWTGNEAYGKNLRIQMGRCPVRSLFEGALEALIRNQHLLGFLTDNVRPLSEAAKWYKEFNEMNVQKVIFEARTISQ